MANSLGSVTWGSSPAITISFSYDYRRSGANMQYQVYASVSPVSGASSFGYPIYIGTYLDGSPVNSQQVKDASTNRWTSSLSYASGWQTVTGKTSGSTALAMNVYSGSGSSRNSWYNFDLYVSPAQSSIGTIQPFNVEDAFSVTVTKYSTNFTDNLSISLDGETIKTIEGYSSGGEIRFTDAEVLKIYNLMTDRKAAFTFTLSTYSGTSLVGSSSADVSGTIAGTARIRLSSAWLRALVWQNVGGTWKRCIAEIKANDAWKRGM